MSAVKNAAILGASGYTGAEAVRLIQLHPNLRITALTGHSRAGKPLAEIYPNFAGLKLPDVVQWEDVNWSDIDVAFACLPHGASQDVIAQIAGQVETVVDLSADFRIKKPGLYEQTYGRSHDYPELLEAAVYGLTEYARNDLQGAQLIACPGCYPTCSLLSLLPAIEAEYIELDTIVIDAKSGATGAGRKLSENLLYCELTDGAQAYAIGNHRHAPEIEQMIRTVSGETTTVSFTPHLLPMNRGMITTIYATMRDGVTVDALREVYHERYAGEPFIHVEAKGVIPQTRHVRGSNQFRLGIYPDRRVGQVIFVGVIDNLTKGSSGQAVQNYNASQGWDETLGLMNLPLFP